MVYVCPLPIVFVQLGVFYYLENNILFACYRLYLLDVLDDCHDMDTSLRSAPSGGLSGPSVETEKSLDAPTQPPICRWLTKKPIWSHFWPF